MWRGQVAVNHPSRLWGFDSLLLHSRHPELSIPSRAAIIRSVSEVAHFHADEYGTLRRCYHRCPSWAKIFVVSGAMNLFWEVATFLPVHRFFEHLGLIH
jgi:hypothetical protein